MFLQTYMNTFRRVVTSRQSAWRVSVLGDAETLRKLAECSVAIELCVQQKSVKCYPTVAVSSSSKMHPQLSSQQWSACNTKLLVSLSLYNQCA